MFFSSDYDAIKSQKPTTKMNQPGELHTFILVTTLQERLIYIIADESTTMKYTFYQRVNQSLEDFFVLIQRLSITQEREYSKKVVTEGAGVIFDKIWPILRQGDKSLEPNSHHHWRIEEIHELYNQLTHNGKLLFEDNLNKQKDYLTTNPTTKQRTNYSWIQQFLYFNGDNFNPELLVEKESFDLLHLQGPWDLSFLKNMGGHKNFTTADGLKMLTLRESISNEKKLDLNIITKDAITRNHLKRLEIERYKQQLYKELEEYKVQLKRESEKANFYMMKVDHQKMDEDEDD
jgi:hypothetical protein